MYAHGADGASDLPNDANIAPKGSRSFIKQTVVRLNNEEIENISLNFSQFQ